ncbi:MAG: sulfate reduction electron transfer complex DsrMKJOP subunit DsrM [Desulfobacterales bacterium]|nr:sulfate reduction electron transfer complex DsrMKJOP subunit DsrM [Desulfobacterales bacterium]
MNVNYMVSLIAVIVLFLLAYVGVEAAGLQFLFGIIVPYLAVIAFIGGVIYRIVDWARSPVPFRITTTGGQQKSLPWIQPAQFDNPSTTAGVIVRMALEILFFRSLFRNTSAHLDKAGKLSYIWEKWLWLGALAFHYAFLTVLVRHLRFFTEPVPLPVKLLETLDGFLQIGIPVIQLSGVVLLAAALFLLLRRVLIPQVKYISLAADFFPIFLLIGIALTGILMRYFTKINVIAAKELAMGLVTFHPSIPQGGIGGIFYVHLFFVCILLAYFPFSKLMHMGGIFLSPTRNMPGNTRAIRHVNPWNYPVKVHTYEEYEDEFREKMIEAGLPVEKE